MSSTEETVKTIEHFGRQGLIVSVVYGPCGKLGDMYSVTVMNPETGKEFDGPFAALTFGMVKQILEDQVHQVL